MSNGDPPPESFVVELAFVAAGILEVDLELVCVGDLGGIVVVIVVGGTCVAAVAADSADDSIVEAVVYSGRDVLSSVLDVDVSETGAGMGDVGVEGSGLGGEGVGGDGVEAAIVVFALAAVDVWNPSPPVTPMLSVGIVTDSTAGLVDVFAAVVVFAFVVVAFAVC